MNEALQSIMIPLPKETSEAVASEAGHWYAGDGTPCYELPAKPGHMRPTTLRDARKRNLGPSVTGIIQCANAPPLNIWKQKQLLMASLTLPRIDGEDTETLAKRITRDAEERGKQGARSRHGHPRLHREVALLSEL